MNRRWIGAALLALTSWAGAHGITFSHVDVRLGAQGTQISAQLPVSALLAEQPGPLPAGTTAADLKGALSAPVKASLTALLTARLKVRAGSVALLLTVTSVRGAGEDVALEVTVPAVTGDLSVTADLFPDDALHKVFVNVYRGSVLAGQYALDHTAATLTLAAPQEPLWQTVLTFIREGIHHIFIGPDHILFVLALILLGGRLGTQVKIITAFTLSHSVTLALATLGLVTLPSRLVESVIALSIIVVGLHDLWQLRRGDRPAGRDLRVPIAATFGVIHGFGFAGVLMDLELPRQALAWALAAFNIGVEIGQVCIVLLATPLLLALRRSATPRVVQGTLSASAAVIVLMGGVWFWQRVL